MPKILLKQFHDHSVIFWWTSTHTSFYKKKRLKIKYMLVCHRHGPATSVEFLRLGCIRYMSIANILATGDVSRVCPFKEKQPRVPEQQISSTAWKEFSKLLKKKKWPKHLSQFKWMKIQTKEWVFTLSLASGFCSVLQCNKQTAWYSAYSALMTFLLLVFWGKVECCKFYLHDKHLKWHRLFGCFYIKTAKAAVAIKLFCCNV